MNGFASTNAIIASSILFLAPTVRDTNEALSRINIAHILNNSNQKASSTLKKSSIIQFVQNSRELRLKEFSNLKEGWDGYNARSISPTVINRTKKILLFPEVPINAEVTPTGRGSIQIEFSLGDSNYFELEISYRKYSVYYEKNGIEKEKDVLKEDIQSIIKEFCS